MIDQSACDPNVCPHCRRQAIKIISPPAVGALVPDDDVEYFCTNCRVHGRRHQFHPLFTVEQPEEALPDMAVCAHHPTKQAVAVCAGTGDFICALCKAEVDGQVFSIQYLDRGGQAAGKVEAPSFDRFIERPDRQAAQMNLISILFCFATPFTGPMALYYSLKARKLHMKNPRFRDLSSNGWIVVNLIFAALVTIVAYGIILGIVFKFGTMFAIFR